VPLRREDRVEDVLDGPVADDHGQPGVEAHPAGGERRQVSALSRATASTKTITEIVRTW
jgi:hypothetical protein